MTSEAPLAPKTYLFLGQLGPPPRDLPPPPCYSVRSARKRKTRFTRNLEIRKKTAQRPKRYPPPAQLTPPSLVTPFTVHKYSVGGTGSVSGRCRVFPVFPVFPGVPGCSLVFPGLSRRVRASVRLSVRPSVSQSHCCFRLLPGVPGCSRVFLDASVCFQVFEDESVPCPHIYDQL